MLTRRGLLRGLGAVIAAPAIVRVSSLMALSPVPLQSGFPLSPLKAEGASVAFDIPGSYIIPAEVVRQLGDGTLNEFVRDMNIRSGWERISARNRALLHA
jgi:hypothetical protein